LIDVLCFVVCFAGDIISFPVEMATIEAKLAELQPIPLDNVKAPQGRGAGHVWTDCTAIVYSFPLGKPLSRSAGLYPTHWSVTQSSFEIACMSHYRRVWPF